MKILGILVAVSGLLSAATSFYDSVHESDEVLSALYSIKGMLFLLTVMVVTGLGILWERGK